MTCITDKYSNKTYTFHNPDAGFSQWRLYIYKLLRLAFSHCNWPFAIVCYVYVRVCVHVCVCVCAGVCVCYAGYVAMYNVINFSCKVYILSLATF